MFAFLRNGFGRLLAVGFVVLGVQPAAAHLEFVLKQFDTGPIVIVSGDFDYADDLAQFSRLVRDGHPKAVTFDSPGGNIATALELGRLIRQNGLDTIQLRGLDCASACAYAFLGGVARFAEPGSIGVHRASLDPSSSTDRDDAVDQIQQMTAGLINYLNEMGVDPGLLQVALDYGSDDIRYLSGSEMEKYRVVTASSSAAPTPPSPDVALNPAPPSRNLDSSSIAPQDWTSYGQWIQIFSRQVMSDAMGLAAQYRSSIQNTFLFEYDNGWFAAVVGPYAPGEAAIERDRLIAAGVIPSDSFVVAGDHFVAPVGDNPKIATAQQSDDPAARALKLAENFQRMWSMSDEVALTYLDTLYASQVTYYGKPTSKQDVMAEKATFAERWPDRQYVMQEDSAKVSCTSGDTCSVSAVVSWRAASVGRGKTSMGTATFVLTFMMGPPARLVGETSAIIDRQRTDLPARDPRLPVAVGQCVKTYISRIATRLQDTPGSGSAVEYANGGYQVSYDQIPAIDNSRLGDPVNLCLVSLPQDCPPGDDRGRTYRAINLTTGATWVEADSSHMCGGA